MAKVDMKQIARFRQHDVVVMSITNAYKPSEGAHVIHGGIYSI